MMNSKAFQNDSDISVSQQGDVGNKMRTSTSRGSKNMYFEYYSNSTTYKEMQAEVIKRVNVV